MGTSGSRREARFSVGSSERQAEDMHGVNVVGRDGDRSSIGRTGLWLARSRHGVGGGARLPEQLNSQVPEAARRSARSCLRRRLGLPLIEDKKSSVDIDTTGGI